MEKKEIKVRLETMYILGLVIVLLVGIIAIGWINMNKNNEKQKENENQNIGNEIIDSGKVNAEQTNEDKITKDEMSKASIVIGGEKDYFAYEGYGANRVLKRQYDSDYYAYETDYLLYKDINKYMNKKYAVYTKNKYLGETIVKPEEGVYADTLYLNYDMSSENEDYQWGDILIDVKYNAIPRTSTKISIPNEIMNNITEIKDYFQYEVEKVDLDGDNKFEYIIALKESGNGDSKIIVANYKGEKIGELIRNKCGYWPGTDKEQEAPSYVELSDVMYIDFDNDGKMEIFLQVMNYEWSDFYVFKYENGNVIGGMVEIDFSEGA